MAQQMKPDLDGRWLVAGLGVTGLSVARYLRRHGAEVVVCDSREIPPALAALRAELPEVETRLGRLARQDLADADRIVASPGLALAHPALAAAARAGIEILGDIELFARAATAPVLAVTGSNGKSTVTTLLGEMLRDAGRRVAVGGNLGTPALDLLGEDEPDGYVLEVSSFQLETTRSLRALAAVVLNLSPDHLDRYPDLASYAAAKARIYQGAALRVINRDDPVAAALAGEGGRRVSFGLDRPRRAADFGVVPGPGGPWLARGATALMRAGELRLPGRHNRANVLAALAMATAAGAEPRGLVPTARRFEGLPHRSRWVAEIDGVRWYDDSKGTNPGATLAAIEGMEGPLVLIAGGDGKGADFSMLREALASKVRACVLIGRDAPRLRAAWDGATALLDAPDMRSAVRLAASLAQPGDSVLLSPACASLDMYRDYAARGDDFAAAVRRLQE